MIDKENYLFEFTFKFCFQIFPFSFVFGVLKALKVNYAFRARLHTASCSTTVMRIAIIAPSSGRDALHNKMKSYFFWDKQITKLYLHHSNRDDYKDHYSIRCWKSMIWKYCPVYMTSINKSELSKWWHISNGTMSFLNAALTKNLLTLLPFSVHWKGEQVLVRC